MAEGYFDAFPREESKLGMGTNGSAFLCQHVLDGNLLGRFAVKIAIGPSGTFLACSAEFGLSNEITVHYECIIQLSLRHWYALDFRMFRIER